MKSRYIFLFIFCMIAPQLIAQPHLKFIETTHDFGNISEGVQAEHTFNFTNTGNRPLVISNVRASCGCTTPYWPKEPIAPGKTGSITASYNSKNRPGPFNKSITITSNSKDMAMRVYIKGTVVKMDEKANHSKEDLAASPILFSEDKLIELGKTEKNQRAPFDIKLTNRGKSPLVLKGLKSPCNCVTFDPGTSKKIPVGQTKIVKFIYTPRSSGDFIQKLTLHSNDLTKKGLELQIKSIVVDKLTKQNMLEEPSRQIKF